jgi:hypothetical protein
LPVCELLTAQLVLVSVPAAPAVDAKPTRPAMTARQATASRMQ